MSSDGDCLVLWSLADVQAHGGRGLSVKEIASRFRMSRVFVRRSILWLRERGMIVCVRYHRKHESIWRSDREGLIVQDELEQFDTLVERGASLAAKKMRRAAAKLAREKGCEIISLEWRTRVKRTGTILKVSGAEQ